MKLSPDDWALVLVDPATNYRMDDYAAGIAHSDHRHTDPQPLLLIEAEHLETHLVMRFTVRVPPVLVGQLAAVFTAMEAQLRQDGATT